MKTTFITLLFFIFSMFVSAQNSDAKRLQAAQEKYYSNKNSILQGVEIPNIGPTIMSGRVTDVEVNPQNPEEMLVAYASGGLWYSNNNGQSFSPISDELPTLTIGDVAVDWKNRTIWLGSGEANSSRSTYAGLGIFRSKDFGKKWEYLGLPESHHIGKILLDEHHSNRAWVAVMGHLYTQNEERGVYYTEDNGQNWKKSLYVNDSTGAIDLIRIPGTENGLLASMWQRDRKAWNFEEAGPGSGIYKSTDGGLTWTKLNQANSGFPNHQHVGRIGLAAYNDQIFYALLDDQSDKKSTKKIMNQWEESDMRKLSADKFISLPDTILKNYLKEKNFPKNYTVAFLKQQVKSGKLTPIQIADYTDNANARLFNSQAIGASLYRSNDGGKTWYKTHDQPLPLYFTYGYYFGNVRISTKNPDHVYPVGFHVMKSVNGGKTFNILEGDNVHVDHHALWINPSNENHLINGNDGGLNISYDGGAHWIKCNNPAVGQFYAVAVDQSTPFKVYGGLQDNGVWYGPHDYQSNVAWHQSGEYPYKNLLGGDGMQIAIDPRDNQTIYTGFQFGNYFKINRSTETEVNITPKHTLGEKPFRFNWQTPIWLSKHHPDMLYLGSNFLHRSLDQGKTWEKISTDLTKGGKPGDVAFGTITTIHESPLKFGLLYVGTDDGNIWMTEDGGNHWNSCNHGLPQNLWVSRVWASNFEVGRVYISLNGYRNDDFNSYIYVSNDYGKTWKSLNEKGLREPVNVIKEDPEREHNLWLGTDNGLYWSNQDGGDWIPASSLPQVAVHDISFQEKERKLLIGTHGRSLYLVDLKKTDLWNNSLNGQVLNLFTDTLMMSGFSIETNSAIENTTTILARWTIWIHPKGDHKNKYETQWVLLQNGKEMYRFTLESHRGLNDLDISSQLFPNGIKSGMYSVQVIGKDGNVIGKSALRIR
jgi:photosystem II stability/assembly factor-like uncharacterized protein